MSDAVREQSLVLLARFNTPWPAEILCARLNADGIPASLPDRNLLLANPLLANAVGGVRMMVPVEQIMHARRIMQSIEHGDYALTADDCELDSPTIELCPNCGSERTVSDERRKYRSLLSAFLFGIPLPFSRSDRRCEDCEHRWRE